MVKPNFLIVGAAKSGTTALYYYLSQHPEIGFPELKEPKYFSSVNLTFPHQGIGDESVDKYAIKDYQKYLTLFDNLKKYTAIGEASPDYLYYHNKTAPLIKEKLGDIKIIIILRNPVKRAFSAYSYLKRDSREKLPFRKSLEKEEERIQNNWDFIWAYKKGGLYTSQVKTFLSTFTNVKIIFQEDLRDKPHQVFKELFDYLNVNSNYEIDNSVENNKSGVPSNIVSKFFLSRNNPISPVLREILKKIVPRNLLENVSSKFLKKIEIEKLDEEYLKEFYKEDIEKLETLVNRNLKSWK